MTDICQDSYDFIFSNNVLEHIDSIEKLCCIYFSLKMELCIIMYQIMLNMRLIFIFSNLSQENVIFNIKELTQMKSKFYKYLILRGIQESELKLIFEKIIYKLVMN